MKNKRFWSLVFVATSDINGVLRAVVSKSTKEQLRGNIVQRKLINLHYFNSNMGRLRDITPKDNISKDSYFNSNMGRLRGYD